ncbi:MAG: hypothetical protein IJE29_02810 [Firmicutes bacterium]|nr:hypothetical protein [Bacillota bacterium]
MKMQHKSIILLVSMALVFGIGIVGTLTYMADSTGDVANIFQPVSVPPEVIEEFDGDVKENVQIRNTGNIDAYIRAQIVANWVSVDDADNVIGIYGGAVPVFGEDYSYIIGEKWTEGSDGYYYYNSSVAANDSTDSLLTEGKVLNTAAVPNGCRLSIEILAQTIQARPDEAVGQAWSSDKVIVTGQDGTLSVKERSN